MSKHSNPVASAGAIPLAGPLAVFVLGGLLGLLASYDPALSIRWLLWLVAGSVLYIATVLLSRTPARLFSIAALVVGAATVGGLLLATQYRHLAFDDKFESIAMLGGLSSAIFPRLFTTHIDANAAAGFLEGALPLALALVWTTAGRQRLAWASCAAIIGYGILLTSSRGAWVALVAVALLSALLPPAHRGAGAGVPVGGARRSLRRWLIVLPFVALLIATLVLLFTAPGQRVLESALFRAHDRLTLYRNSLFLALDFPFTGIGAGPTFGMVYSYDQLLIVSEYLGYAHNLFLAVWLAQGLLGLLGFGAMILVAARLIWRGLSRSDGSSVARICWGAALGCLVVLLHGLTDAPQYDSSWPTLFMNFLLLGVAIAAAQQLDDRPLHSPRLTRRSGVVTALAAAVALLLLGPGLLGSASANIASVLATRANLHPHLTDPERTTLHSASLRWVARGRMFTEHNAILLKRQGLLALDDRDFVGAIAVLEPALQRSPADQSIRKALGYAYIWDGRVNEGVQLLQRLDRVAEVRQELEVWPLAWQERGRNDLAIQAHRAAALLPR